MRQDPEWRRALGMVKGKERNELFRRLNRQYRLTGFDVHADIARHREGTKRKSELSSNEAQKLATQAFNAVSCCIFKQGGRPRFKSFKRGLRSLEGKTNATGLKFRPEKMLLDWCRKTYQVMLDPKDAYALEALYAEQGTHEVQADQIQPHRQPKHQGREALLSSGGSGRNASGKARLCPGIRADGD